MSQNGNNNEFDVIIIGGGITGAGTARDCAMRGLKVLLIERHDIATGATGRNHGLLHSGARYAVTDQESARECIKENIERHLGENVGMQAILANVYFSANYANTLFKEATGMTIHQYQMQRRLSRAAQLLVDEPEVRVKDIAWRCGFSDASHLINSFRRAYGCSPDKYRRRHLRP